jgi:hypothetical protein
LGKVHGEDDLKCFNTVTDGKVKSHDREIKDTQDASLKLQGSVEDARLLLNTLTCPVLKRCQNWMKYWSDPV